MDVLDIFNFSSCPLFENHSFALFISAFLWCSAVMELCLLRSLAAHPAGCGSSGQFLLKASVWQSIFLLLQELPYGHHSFLPHNVRKEDLWDQDVGSMETCSLLLRWGQESSQWLFHIRQGHQSQQSIKNYMFLVCSLFASFSETHDHSSFLAGPAAQGSVLRRHRHLV